MRRKDRFKERVDGKAKIDRVYQVGIESKIKR